jgi:uncharacterized protein
MNEEVQPSDPVHPRTIAVSGSTGLIGSALIDSLRKDGHRIRRIVRGSPPTGSPDVSWEPNEGVLDPAALDGVDAVVHLSGENIGQRWTAEVRRKLRESRVRSTRLLSAAIASLVTGPRALVVAGGVGIYGDRGDELLDEESATGSDFLADLGRDWEAAADPARRHGIRVVNARFGVVLSPDGGALQRLLLPFKSGVGGPIGSGKQWMSWISRTDLVRAIRFALDEAALEGPVNMMSPNPVRNEEFAHTLGSVLRRPSLFRVPASALRLLYGEMADATLLASQRVLPRKLERAGFTWLHPDLRTALEAELKR